MPPKKIVEEESEETKEIRRKRFLENPAVNPRSGRAIEIGGVTYNILVKAYGEPDLAKLNKKEEEPVKNKKTKKSKDVS